MPKVSNWYLPVSFYFNVEFQGSPRIGNVAFKEVSGISTEMELETIQEGGANDCGLRLPKAVSHSNLVLKRAIMPVENNLGLWVTQTLESDFSAPLQLRDLIVHLLNEDGDSMFRWSCRGAYPVKWITEGFDAERNTVAVETLELICKSIKREQ